MNFLPLSLDMSFPAELTDEDRIYRDQIRHWQIDETGYSLIQAADTGLCPDRFADGLAAWIAEKFYV